ncbi:MAG: hypothetical protein GY913_07810 [Proteobacteria bacterium]|nr:hypothetical protein [Pseudomonadota bacterium]
MDDVVAVGRLTSGIAHDFAGLLTVLSMSAGALRTGLSESERLEELDILQEAVEKAAALTQRLRSFGSQGAVERQVVDLRERLGTAAGLFGRITGGRVRLEVDFADVPVRSCVDVLQLDQVMLNLVTNARDAGATRVVLRVGQQVADESIIGLNGVRCDPGAYACLEIEDDGQGMGPSTLECAFEPFFTTRSEEGGTGFGLATVWDSANRHSWPFQVDSRPRVGTRFRFWMPLAS